MTSPVIEHSHGSRPRPNWRRRQDDRFTNYARARARQERTAKHGDRVGDRQHAVRPAQSAAKMKCTSVVTIDLRRQLTRREHSKLSLMLSKIKGVSAINFQGGSVLCAVDLNAMGMNLAVCELVLQEQIQKALE